MQCTLFVDTSLSSIGLALKSRSCYEKVITCGQKSSAQLLTSSCDELIKKVGIQHKDIVKVVASVGPGSFTGIRIGLAWMMGYARASKLDIISMSGLEAAFWHICQKSKLSWGDCGLIYPNTKTHVFIIYYDHEQRNIKSSLVLLTASSRWQHYAKQWISVSPASQSLNFCQRLLSVKLLQEYSLKGMSTGLGKQVLWQKHGFPLQPRYLRLSTAEENFIEEDANT